MWNGHPSTVGETLTHSKVPTVPVCGPNRTYAPDATHRVREKCRFLALRLEFLALLIELGLVVVIFNETIVEAAGQHSENGTEYDDEAAKERNHEKVAHGHREHRAGD
jgi:hypothetical protein